MTCACVDIKTLVQPQQHRYRKNPDVPRLNPIHGNLDGRAREALKYLVAVRRSAKVYIRNYVIDVDRQYVAMQFIVVLNRQQQILMDLSSQVITAQTNPKWLFLYLINQGDMARNS